MVLIMNCIDSFLPFNRPISKLLDSDYKTIRSPNQRDCRNTLEILCNTIQGLPVEPGVVAPHGVAMPGADEVQMAKRLAIGSFQRLHKTLDTKDKLGWRPRAVWWRINQS